VARSSAKPCSAAFAAEYGPPPPRWAAIELVRMIRPPGRRIDGSSASVSSTAVSTFESKVARQRAASSSGVESSPATKAPALLTTTSTGRPATAWTTAAVWPGTARSAVTAVACGPIHFTASASTCGRRPTMMTS
jgi:hypothetical protein